MQSQSSRLIEAFKTEILQLSVRAWARPARDTISWERNPEENIILYANGYPLFISVIRLIPLLILLLRIKLVPNLDLIPGHWTTHLELCVRDTFVCS